MKKRIMQAIAVVCCIGLVGCSTSPRTKREIPNAKYNKVGHATNAYVESDGTVKVTYVIIGLMDEKVEYLYLDQAEQNPKKDRHSFTNNELSTAYGLSYESEYGEWNEQVAALQRYIAGNNMTIEDINNIALQEIDGKLIAEEGSDLAAGCQLDLSIFLEVIVQAMENAVEVETMRIAVGESVRFSKINNSVKVSLAFVATDYRFKLNYVVMDEYEIEANVEIPALSYSERAKSEAETQAYVNDLNEFEKHISGFNIVEAYTIPTYDIGNGSDTALPQIDTDLAEVCNIDLQEYLIALEKAAGRLR